MTQIIKPPLTEATANACVQADEEAWNARDPKLVAGKQTEDARWRIRDEVITGREAIEEFLARQWRRQLHFRLRSELQSYTSELITVRFVTEWQDSVIGTWFRSHGTGHWSLAASGLMRQREVNAADRPIRADERLCAAAAKPFPNRVPRTHESKATR
jgi:nuclear transport factor 2 (NTF2) superfamily protein